MAINFQDRTQKLKEFLELNKHHWSLEQELGIKADRKVTPKFHKVKDSLDENDPIQKELKTFMEQVINPTSERVQEKPSQVKEEFYETQTHKLARKLFDAGFNLYFFGEAGSGKTTFARILATQNKVENYYLVSCSTDMTPMNLIGHFEMQGEESPFILGPLPRAMMEGKTLILDEFDRVCEEVASKLHEVLESGRILVEQTNETIKAEDSFRIIATGNSDMGGSTSYNTLALDLASIDRFEFIKFDYVDKDYEILCNLGLTSAQAKQIAELSKAIRKQQLSCVFSTRRMKAFGHMIVSGISSSEALEVAYLSRLNKDERKAVKGLETLIASSEVEVWSFSDKTPEAVLDDVEALLGSKQEGAIFRKTRTVLANDKLVQNKNKYKQYITTVAGHNMSGVSPEEFMGTGKGKK